MNAGERAARERVEAVYEAVDRLTPDDLRLTPLAVRDMEARDGLLADLERLADRNGRGELLDEARDWLRDAVAARTLARYQPEAGVWGVPAGGVVEDQVSVFLALEDMVSVAVVGDLLDPADAASLSDPGRMVVGLTPLPIPGEEPEPPANAWEPSASDWAAASGGPTAVDPDEPLGGGRALQRTFFGVLGVSGVVGALGVGFANDQPVLGVLGAVAIGLLAWTFATWRSSGH